MRTSSSRQVSGSETVCTTAGKPLFVVVGVGISESRAWPTGSMGTFAKLGTLGQSGVLTGTHRSVKSPLRSAFEGTFTAPVVCGFFSRRHSSEKKKNVFLLLVL